MIGHRASTDLKPTTDVAQSARVVRLLSPRQMVTNAAGVGAWLVVLLIFWVWWIGSVQGTTPARFWVNTFAVAWLTLLPLYFLSFFMRAREMRGPLSLPFGSRVAMVVTKAPSEPWPVVRRTLKAMLSQDYPHDTWLADEDPSDETRQWCAEHSVEISSRKGVAGYHQQSWPRRTRCKEGNLAYFYDHFGYDRYDFVAQMDADHVPAAGYLSEMLKPFADPRVGYVTAPSICDANSEGSWAARGRLYSEATMHGLLQAGYSAGWAPLCIGSHYAVRTVALRQIGGLGPELAEDHSTTLHFNAGGWKGMHAFSATAHGDGPQTFADMVIQEFQWSRSLTNILLKWLPSSWGRLNGWLRFQFVFAEMWYPLLSLVMLGLYLMPIYAILTGVSFVDVPLIDFYLHIVWLGLIGCVLASTWKRNGWLKPADAKLMSWEGVLFILARWPWVLCGVLAAFYDQLAGRTAEFKITPKGESSARPMPIRVIAPYLLLSAASSLVALFVDAPAEVGGFYFFCIVQGVLYALVAAVAWSMHVRESSRACRRISFDRALALRAALVILLIVPTVAIANRRTTLIEGVLWGTDRYQLTEVLHPVSGAGRDGRAIRVLRVRLPWSALGDMNLQF